MNTHGFNFFLFGISVVLFFSGSMVWGALLFLAAMCIDFNHGS